MGFRKLCPSFLGNPEFKALFYRKRKEEKRKRKRKRKRKLKRHHFHVPIVFVITFVNIEELIRCWQFGEIDEAQQGRNNYFWVLSLQIKFLVIYNMFVQVMYGKTRKSNIWVDWNKYHDDMCVWIYIYIYIYILPVLQILISLKIE